MVRVGISGPMDRILRAGGMVLVTAVGAISITAASGQAATMTANGGSVAVSAAGEVQLNPLAGQVVQVGNATLRGYVGGWNITAAGAASFGGTLTVSSAGISTFSGPVKASYASGNTTPSFLHDASGTNSARAFGIQRTGAYRFIVDQENTSQDVRFYTATGAAGSEVFTESFRILNVSGYTQFASRAGFGISPSYPVHISGHVSGYSLVATNGGWFAATTAVAAVNGIANHTGANGALFRQDAASATVPIVSIIAGATYASGTDRANLLIKAGSSQTADLTLWQNSAGSAVAYITASGSLSVGSNSWIFDAGQKYVRWTAAGSAPGTADAGTTRIWYDNTAKAFKYIDDTGATRTITAA